MPYVEAAGAKLYFEESGYGYPIIFIHEFASDIRGWEAQVRYFSRSYRCIATMPEATRPVMSRRCIFVSVAVRGRRHRCRDAGS